MIKKLSFLAALLAPGLAFGANPSADLSVQIVPAGTTTSTQCPSVAPAEAQAAGFTTMALCNDFTQPIPNTAGTGLPANWLGVMDANNSCAYSDTTPHVWYQTLWYLGCSPPYNEPGSGIQQVTDPANGNLALRIGYTQNDQVHYQYQSITTMSPSTGQFQDYPQASLIEWTFRDITESVTAGAPNNDFWTWTRSAATGCNGCVLEYDIFEDWGVNSNSAGIGNAVHNWWAGNQGAGGWGCGVYGRQYVNPGVGGPCPFGSPANFTTATYHTYGMLITTDGATAIWACGYVDHVLRGSCKKVPESLNPNNGQGGGFGQRNFLINWFGIAFDDPGQGYCPSGADCINQDMFSYIKSVDVWTCSDWNNPSGANYTCKFPNLINSGGNIFFRP